MKTKVVTGWRKGVIHRKIAKRQAEGYALLGPVQFGHFGATTYVATMVKS